MSAMINVRRSVSKPGAGEAVVPDVWGLVSSLRQRCSQMGVGGVRWSRAAIAGLISLSSLLVPGSLLAQGTPISGTAQVTVTPSASTINMGTSVQVTLRVDLTSVTGRDSGGASTPAVLGGYQVAITFDKTMLQLLSVAGGTSTGYTGTPTFTQLPIANANGSVTITASQADSAAPVGLVTVAVLTFSGIGPGTSSLTPTPVSLSTAFQFGAAGSPALIPGNGVPNSVTVNASGNPVPVITSISPNSTTAGGGNFTLTVNGSNFITTSVVRWAGSDRVTSFVSANQLTAAIPASDLLSAGVVPVTVFSPGPGGGSSNAVNFTVNAAGNPIPGIINLSPSSTTAGGVAFTLSVNGSNFVAASQVRWNGANRTTAFVSTNQLTASITAVDIATAGTAAVTVFNPAPGGGLSNTANFTINNVSGNPVPAVTTINPTTAVAGGAAFTLTVNGTGFVNGAVVRANGSNRTTNFVSATQLTASILASDIASAGSLGISVFNPAPGGGVSNTVNLTVSPTGNPVPVISTLNPPTVAQGNPTFTLNITGTNFVNGAIIYFNGTPRSTSFISSTAVRTQIAASSVAVAGSYPVTVLNPSPGGGFSNLVNFIVTGPGNPVPSITSLTPTSVTPGSAAFTLGVIGVNFVSGSVVRWNGVDRPTTFVNAGRVNAAIPAADVAAAGSFGITVFNPAPGGGLSNVFNFTVTVPGGNPVPTLANINPTTAAAGSAAFTLTVNGSNFVNGAVVRWNGAARTTTFVAANQVTASIPASDVSAGGSFAITVLNPAPGGGVSNTINFTVTGGAGNPTPALTSVNPASATAGSGAITLTASGSNFVPGAVVRWNGVNRPTNFVSANQLTASIPASDLASATTALITTANPAPGGGVSSAITFTVSTSSTSNPVPVISNLSPSSVGAGAGSFTLRVDGSNFVPNSVVRWNGSERATTYHSATRLTANIGASETASIGSASVTVFNPAPGGGLSNAVTLSISGGNPVPRITSLNPSSVAAGSDSFTLAIDGVNFVDSGARWNGSPMAVLGVGPTRIFVRVPAVDLLEPGTAFITVFNPPPGGGVSEPFPFTITSGGGTLQAEFEFLPSNPVAGEPVSFTDRSSGAVTTWRWLFGDGTSSSRNPTHVFAEAGTYAVTLVASNATATSTRTRSVVVSPAANLKFTSVLPVTTQIPGLGETYWRSEVTFHNFGREAATIDLFHLPSAGGTRRNRQVTIPAGSTKTYPSILPDVFGIDSGSGGLVIEARGATRTPQIRVSSRTFTTNGRGTYGQFVQDVGPALPATSYLTGIESNTNYRTNIGFVNKSGGFSNTVLTLYTSSGELLGTNAVSVPANGFQQLDLLSLFPTLRGQNESGMSLKVQAPVGGAVAAYASIIDNRSQDPVYIPAIPAPVSRELIVPAVARIPGASETFWRSDVTFFNPTSNTMTLVVHLVYADRDNRNARGRVITLHPNRSETIQDVVEWLEAGNSSGGLQIVASGGSGGGPVVSSRTYTTRLDDGGTYGQWVGAFETKDFTSQTVLTGLRSDGGYRTNLGFVNSGNESLVVDLTLHDASGPIGSATVTLLPKSQRQLPMAGLFPSANAATLGTFTVRAKSQGAQTLLSYGSTIDNQSGDPIFVNGR